MEHNTPRTIVLQLGAFISLFISIAFVITLVFGLITIIFPDATDSYWEIESATDSIRLGIAMVVVFFPAYVVLTRWVNQGRRRTDAGYQNLTRWLLYLALLGGGIVLLSTAVTVLYTFLNGEITVRFLFKAATVAIITGLAFYYYLADSRGYWLSHERESVWIGAVVSFVVLFLIGVGFMHIETPTAVREMKLDEKQVDDLRIIQHQIENYLETSSTTPSSLAEAFATARFVPVAPEGRPAYEYLQTDDGFALCATFSRDYQDPYRQEFSLSITGSNPRIKQADNWDYTAGRYCFERVVE